MILSGLGVICNGVLLLWVIGQISTSEINPGETFLILQGAKESSHRYNRKLYVEVMTEKGPRIAWASIFKMRKVASEMEVLS